MDGRTDRRTDGMQHLMWPSTEGYWCCCTRTLFVFDAFQFSFSHVRANFLVLVHRESLFLERPQRISTAGSRAPRSNLSR